MTNKKTLARLFLAALLALSLIFLYSCSDECQHRDANDDNKCDYCEARYMDGREPCSHRDANDDGKCDKCTADFTDLHEVHTDENDDGKCDLGGEDFTDGCDCHRDGNDDGRCDVEGCGAEFSDGCDLHSDANDDGKCDVEGCGKDFFDGCDIETCLDSDGDGRCDNDGCDKETDNKLPPSDGKITLTVTVTDASGAPIAGVKVQVCKEGEACQKPQTSGNDGKVVFTVDKGVYYASLAQIPEGYTSSDEDGKFYFGDASEITVVLTEKPSCLHEDKNDDGKCDACGATFDDGCDAEHRDANDDGKCDLGGEAFDDGAEKTYSGVIIENGKSDYRLVYGTINNSIGGAASIYALAEEVFYPAAGVDFAYKKYNANMGTDMLIVFGAIEGIEVTERLVADIDSKASDSFAYGFAYKNGVFVIYANSKAAFDKAPTTKFDGSPFFADAVEALKALIVDGKLAFDKEYYYVYELKKSEYDVLVSNDNLKYNEKLIQIKEEKIEFLIDELGKFNTADFGTKETGSEFTADFGYTITPPKAYPKDGEHPRVLFTKEDIPAIRAKLEASEGTDDYKRFMSYISVEEQLTGILPAPTQNSRGYHNWNGSVLNAIQANALYYALYGDEYFGYTAIYAIKNFLLTLEVDYIVSDQCREFGNVMYVAACVYDWCYDLLSELDALQICVGVEHKLCRGSVPNTLGGIASTSSTIKMEMGFPPASQHALVGHGSEFQLLRDYLAMAIAIYDEAPGWYEFIAGRYYKEFVPVREVFYETGAYPQGTATYGPWRYLADCYSAALIDAATGTNPFSTDMAEVVYQFASHETTNGGLFLLGDGSNRTLPTVKLGYEAIILSHIFSDEECAPLLRLMSTQMVKQYSETNPPVIRCPEYFIFASREVEPIEDVESWRELLPNIRYNGGYVGQYIVRNRWDNEGAVALMRIGEVTTANHDHEDAGTFQIHYKGLTTGPSGIYDSYGSVHWSRYYQATVSKNGILVFDPSRAAEERGFYSGSQKTKGDEPTGLDHWQSGSYTRAEVIGRADGYAEDGVSAKYAYLAGDITKAYSGYTPSAVSYVGRSMLTVYTEDETVPMVMFVFDRIDAVKANFVKKFLLQVNGTNEPEIDDENKTVSVTSGDGRLVLQNILGCDEIVGIGGGAGKNFMINGKQCYDDTPTAASWGRVELQTSGNKSDLMLNVMYVTDAKNKTVREAVGVSGVAVGGTEKLLEGATVCGVTALFATGTSPNAEAVEFTADGEGDMSYYVGGLAAGEWEVYVDGELLATETVSAESGFMTFDAESGATITLVPNA